MKCQKCGNEEAVVHLTQIVDDQMKTLHLCEPCAAEQGLASSAVPENFALTDFLANLGPGGLGKGPESEMTSRSCSFCGLTLKEFKESGRLGCPHCWASFESDLRDLVRRIHGSSQHLGKIYLSPDPSVSEREKQLEALKRKLQRAVELEDFERAAELRDEIRSVEPVG